MTRQIVCVLVVPMPMAASRILAGTMRIASSDVNMFVGIISSESAAPPAQAEKPVARTMRPYAKTPARIEGKPVSTLAENRTARASQLPAEATSAK